MVWKISGLSIDIKPLNFYVNRIIAAAVLIDIFREIKRKMKKTFKLTHPKIKVARLIEAIKNEIRKYLKRERRKGLPEDVDFWDFDCKFGETEESTTVIHVDDITKNIDQAESKKFESFYLEIIAKPGQRSKKPKEIETTGSDDPIVTS